VTINGRSYPVTCAEGEEERISELARQIDEKIAVFGPQAKTANEARLLVIAALMLADELATSREKLSRRQEIPPDEELAAGIDEVAARLEAIAARLETPHIQG
ncbi:MAG TPA: cell division protein ZapA, partial [Stellaceae bacterium]|nr:cell division protein ZapA [Stellaceae bacterium]